jgi:hypothetical protein
MHSRLYKKIGILGLIALTAGCVQATRHSNVMIFGTNTTFGIKAGASTGEVPEVIVGYDRQEAVIMPLLANTRDDSVSPSNRLKPCDVAKPLDVSGGKYAVHPCSFVAIKGGGLDSYSVLASFGAEFSAKANTNPEASGGLAQYFATGMAAQILAARGGAALVSTSKSAADSMKDDVDVQGLFPAKTPFAVGSGKEFDNKLVQLNSEIRGAGSPAILKQKMQGLVDFLKPKLPHGAKLVTACSSADKCIDAVSDQSNLLLDSDNFSEAVESWKDY